MSEDFTRVFEKGLENMTVLTVSDVVRMTDHLHRANAPMSAFGSYFVFISLPAHEDMEMMRIECDEYPRAPYRVQQMAVGILRHERRRWLLKKRAMPTAREAWQRAWSIEARCT